MSGGGGHPFRIALLHHSLDSPVGGAAAEALWQLASALGDAGQQPCILTSHVGPTRRNVEDGIPVVQTARLPEAPLRWRGIDGPITHVPLTLRALFAGHHDVAHAFSPQDAAAALLWGRLAERPVVFTCTETLTRASVAHRRLRLKLLANAVQDADTVIVPTEDAQAALWRWLAVDATVIEPGNAAEHLRLYRRLQ